MKENKRKKERGEERRASKQNSRVVGQVYMKGYTDANSLGEEHTLLTESNRRKKKAARVRHTKSCRTDEGDDSYIHVVKRLKVIVNMDDRRSVG